MGHTVLVCDDAIFMRTMISDILAQAGFEIVGEAETGTQAVEKYRQLKPDLVTMDIVMPDMGGIDAVREIVKNDPDAKILMCSAMGQQALVVEAIQAGAKDFVVKPFQPSRVLEAVQRVSASDNVVELMVHRLVALSSEARQALRVAACLGNVFRLSTLASLLKRSPDAAARMLWEPLQEALIVPLDINGEPALGLVLHWATSEDPVELRAISRALAAGFYEYSPGLFETAGLAWQGPPIAELKRAVWPDFHHAADLVRAGGLVEFLSDEAAESFSLFGSAEDVASQLRRALSEAPGVEWVVPHPVPPPQPGSPYKRWLAEQVMSRL